MKTVLISLVSAIVGGLVVVGVSQPGSDLSPELVAQERGPGFPLVPIIPEKRPRRNTFRPMESVEEKINVAVYEKVNRSVVNITTETRQVNRLFLLEQIETGSGSGAVLDRRGHIVTNYHVVEEARSISVTLYDGTTHEAKLIGADAVNDIAVIKIEASEKSLHPIEFGDSSKLKVGMRVFAIGNPFGFERTLSAGIISSLNRSLRLHGNRKINSIIQIDASVNPGNSGGPLLDTRGRVIGINTAIASKTGQSAGVGFAIPVGLIKRVVPQLLKHGKVIRPEIGIARVYETDKGLLVARLTPNGAAEKAGILGPKIVRQQRGPIIIERIDRTAADLIVKLNGRKIESVDSFLNEIESRKRGDVVRLTVLRDGRRVVVSVTLQ